MVENKSTVDIVEYVAKDGKVFKLNIEYLQNELKKECERHDKDHDTYYEIRNFKVDENLLKEYKSENWKHFKYDIIKHVCVYRQSSFNNMSFLSIDDINKIDTEEKFINFISDVIAKKDNLVFDNKNINLYSKLYGSGLFDYKKLHITFNDNGRHNYYDLLYDAIEDVNIDLVKYIVETLNVEIEDVHMIESFNTHHINRYHEKKEDHFNTKVEYTNPLSLTKGYNHTDEEIRLSKKLIYYTSEKVEEIIKYLYSKYKGDMNDVSKELSSSHYFYEFTKKLKIKLKIHKESYSVLKKFNELWYNHDVNIDFDEMTIDSKDYEHKITLPTLELFEFLWYNNKPDLGHYQSKIEDIVKILKYYNYEPLKIYYYLTCKTNYNKSIDKFHEKLIKEIENHNIKIDYYSYKTIDNNKEYLLYKLKDNKTIDSLKEYLNTEYIDNFSTIKKIVDIIPVKETIIKLSSLHKKRVDLVEDDLVLIDHKTDIKIYVEKLRNITYEDFINYTKNVNDEEYKKEILKKIQELQKEIDESNKILNNGSRIE
ncbi:hypothetical protein M0Q50_10500 [bacterium]|jgi:hypothetical protein|nr:hypothetical protein [bacterium]